MDIQLKARLSAYSNIKIENCTSQSVTDITKEQIDSLFDDTTLPRPVSKEDIDSLFVKGE